MAGAASSSPRRRAASEGSTSPATQQYTMAPADLRAPNDHRSRPPQITVSTPSSSSRLTRSRCVQSPTDSSCRSAILPSSTVITRIDCAQSNRGDTRFPKVGMAIFMRARFLLAVSDATSVPFAHTYANTPQVVLCYGDMSGSGVVVPRHDNCTIAIACVIALHPGNSRAREILAFRRSSNQGQDRDQCHRIEQWWPCRGGTRRTGLWQFRAPNV